MSKYKLGVYAYYDEDGNFLQSKIMRSNDAYKSRTDGKRVELIFESTNEDKVYDYDTSGIPMKIEEYVEGCQLCSKDAERDENGNYLCTEYWEYLCKEHYQEEGGEC